MLHNWNEIFKIVSIISSFCSVVALPITLWQIFSVKTEISAAQKGINEILSIREHEKLEELLTKVKRQHSELVDISALSEKKGVSEDALKERSNKMINELNQCMCDMPLKYEKIADSIHETILMIRSNKINDAEGYLYNSIQQLKAAINECYVLETQNATR